MRLLPQALTSTLCTSKKLPGSSWCCVTTTLADSLDALPSRSLGFAYFAQHPKLLNSVRPLIVKSITWSAVTLVLVTFFTYLPQVAILAFVSGPLAFIAAAVAVLGETYLIASFITKAMLKGGATDAVFDAVLAQKGYDELVSKGRQVNKQSGASSLGKSLLQPITSKYSTAGLVRYLLTLPLNAIPVVGTAFFLGYNGMHAGPGAHARYFQLKGLSKPERDQQVQKRKGAYTAFGTVVIALGLVPVVGSAISAFAGAAGGALWAAELEKQDRQRAGQGAVREGADVSVGRDEL